VLADIGGKPMLQRVLDQCAKATRANDVFLCTDSEELRDIAAEWGYRTLMTPASCTSGTDRIALAAQQLDHDVIVNVQGDQPFVDPKMIDAVIADFVSRSPRPMMLTPIFVMKPEAIMGPNSVKVVRRSNGDAIYFSRSPIPFQRDAQPSEWTKHTTYWGHVGLYAYSQDALAAWRGFASSSLEDLEKLEQLRFIEHGVAVSTIVVDEPLGEVNVAEDLDLARKIASQPRD
jgi:3-deoxy-manno-octulosonate cytidylyltransferase (CMP-KDO synthetase)